MVRTAANAVKTGGGKNTKGINNTAPRYRTGSSSGSKSKGFRGLTNSRTVKRDKPDWQKPITSFMQTDAKFREPKNEEEIKEVESCFNTSAAEIESDCETELKAPDWQKPIPDFLKPQTSEQDEESSGSGLNKKEEKEDSEEDNNSTKRKGAETDDDTDDETEKENVNKNPPKRFKINYAKLIEYEKL